MDKYIGKKLDGRYEIRELIGVGGMANVYKAYDVLENRVVAVKILREEYMNNDEFMRRFRNESRAISLWITRTSSRCTTSSSPTASSRSSWSISTASP